MDKEIIRSTTVLSVRREGKVVVGGDGQVSMGNTVMKGNARKVRRMHDGKKRTDRRKYNREADTGTRGTMNCHLRRLRRGYASNCETKLNKIK